MIWIKADFHLFHKNKIKYGNYSFKNNKKVAEIVLRNISSKIDDDYNFFEFVYLEIFINNYNYI